MKRSEVMLMVLQVPLDYVLLVLAGMSAYWLRFADWAVALKPVIFELTLLEFTSYVSAVALGWIILFALVGLYAPNPNRKLSSDIMRVILACSAGLAAVAVYIMFTQQLFDSRFLVAAGWGFALAYVIAGRLFMRGVKAVLYRLGIGLRRIVVIGSEAITETIVATLRRRPELGFQVIGEFPSFSAEAANKLKTMRIDELLFTNPRANEKETLRALDFANEHHIVFKYSADLFATYAANMSVHPLAGVPVVELKRTRLGAWGRVVKRLFDIVVSLLLIIILSPVMFVTTLIILIETGRPIIFKNERVGLRGKKFYTLKFRSMYQKDCTGVQFGDSGKRAEAKLKALIKKQNSKSGPIYKIKDDPRVTPFGRFIRRWSIDELPQFFNVLGGSMSIVGPRPHQPMEVSGYGKEHRGVFTLKPGVTGLAQISGRSDLSYEEEMKLDILYIERWSVFLDIIIFLKTPFVLFKKRNVL